MKVTTAEIAQSPLAARIFMQTVKVGLNSWTISDLKEDEILLPSDGPRNFSFPTEIKAATKQPVSKEDVGGETNAFNALWLFLLTEGSSAVLEVYGISYPESHDVHQAIHLGICGLDEERSTMPQDTSWSHFVNTYAENDQTRGIEGRATCRCNEVNDKPFYYEISSDEPELASILVKISSY